MNANEDFLFIFFGSSFLGSTTTTNTIFTWIFTHYKQTKNILMRNKKGKKNIVNITRDFIRKKNHHYTHCLWPLIVSNVCLWWWWFSPAFFYIFIITMKIPSAIANNNNHLRHRHRGSCFLLINIWICFVWFTDKQTNK